MLVYRIDYAYDAKNRVTTETQYDAAGASLGVVTYSYDTNPYNGTFTQNGTGRPNGGDVWGRIAGDVQLHGIGAVSEEAAASPG